jgi:hypothetical protein
MKVSLLIEVPEDLVESLQSFLDRHPGQDQDRVMVAALSLFLMQNGNKDKVVVRQYLDSLFHEVAA